jgi:hypothetical protein
MLAVAGLIAMVTDPFAASRVEPPTSWAPPPRRRRPVVHATTAAMREEIERWNAEVDRRKAEKKARRAGR